MARIAIVGAGLVGQCLALMLEPDFEVHLIEAQPAPEHIDQFDVRATALSVGSQKILQRFQLWDAIERQATPILQVQVSDQGHLFGSVIDHQRFKTPALGYVCENHHLYTGLAAKLAQSRVTLHQPVDVIALQATHSGAQLELSDGQSLPVDLAIIADGAQSPLRRSLGIQVESKDFKQTALVTTVALDRPHEHIAYERFTANGPLALLPLSHYQGRPRAAVVWTQPIEQQARLLSITNDECIDAIQNQLGYRAGRITQIGQRQAYPLHAIFAREQVRSSIALMGNAAHFLHPVAGQGLNLALRDCEALCKWVDRKQPGRLSTLLDYYQARIDDQERTWSLTGLLVKLFSNSHWAPSVARQLGLMGLQLVPSAQQQLGKQLMGAR